MTIRNVSRCSQNVSKGLRSSPVEKHCFIRPGLSKSSPFLFWYPTIHNLKGARQLGARMGAALLSHRPETVVPTCPAPPPPGSCRESPGTPLGQPEPFPWQVHPQSKGHTWPGIQEQRLRNLRWQKLCDLRVCQFIVLGVKESCVWEIGVVGGERNSILNRQVWAWEEREMGEVPGAWEKEDTGGEQWLLRLAD